jgi:hypothetical protein
MILVPVMPVVLKPISLTGASECQFSRVPRQLQIARISKGQGYQGFLRKRAGSSFGPRLSCDN